MKSNAHIGILSATLACLLGLASLHAQDRALPAGAGSPAPRSTTHEMDAVIQINVAVPFEPTEAVGLLLSSQGVGEKRALKLEKIHEGLYVVSFGYLVGEVRKDTFASAMVSSANGETAFGDIRSLHPAAKKESFYNLPKCPPQRTSAPDPSKFGSYEKVAHMRLERRSLYRKEIDDLMKGSFLDSLQKLEKGFGLSRGTLLSADLPPVELIDRLSRLLPVVRDLAERDKRERERQ
jgi:hypothetical protein